MTNNLINNTIFENLSKAEQNGVAYPEKVYEIFKNAIDDILTQNTDEIDDIKPIIKDAVINAAKKFYNNKDDENKNMESAVKGLVEGVRLNRSRKIEALENELHRLETEIILQKKKLVRFTAQAIQGISEAEEILPEKIKKTIQPVIQEIKQKDEKTKSPDTGINNVKNAVKQAVESGLNVKQTVMEITKEATEKALREGKLKADEIRRTTEKILSDAVNAAEETGKNVKEVADGAFKGIHDGIASMAGTAADTAKKFVNEDLSETKDDLKTIKDLFLETVLKVGKRSGETAKKILDDLVNESKAAGDTLKKQTGSAADRLSAKLKNIGKEAAKTLGTTGEKAARIVTNEAKEIGKKSISIAKGSITGMWKGAREALEKTEKEETKKKAKNNSDI